MFGFTLRGRLLVVLSGHLRFDTRSSQEISAADFFGSADSGYCMRAVEPGWYRYHVTIYVLQGILVFILPIIELYKILF